MLFPGPERLAALGVGDLDGIRCGFRARYLLDAARRVSSGEISLERIAALPSHGARAELMQIVGVGKKVADCGNIAVVVIDEAEKAVPLAHALLEGGVTVMELTFRTACAAEALRRVATEVPEMIISAGTILTKEQLQTAKDAGAHFAVAPGFNPRIVSAAMEMGLPFAPGVMTPSEIEGAVELGCTLLKFFPASVVGGIKAIETLAAPYKHLGLRYIPLGGLKPENTGEYLASPLIAACGGSWIAPAKLIKASDWSAITANAAKATEIAHSVRA